MQINEKTFSEFLISRHSIRLFKKESISEDLVKKIMALSSLGPSAGNLQSYRVVAVRDISTKKILREASHQQDYVENSSLVLVFCADKKRSSNEYGDRGANLFSIQDATILCSYAQLVCHSMGLGTVWVGSFDDLQVSKILHLENHLLPVAMLCIGNADEKPEPTPRREIEDYVKII